MEYEKFCRITELEKKYVDEVLETNFRSSSGAVMMQRLEKTFAKLIGKNYAVSFINGTETMHAVLEALGIGEGDEVIVPPLTMSSTSFAVLQSGATPVFADVCEDSFLINPESIKDNITDKTKAIIPVSLYGMMPKMDEIMDIAKNEGLFVLEDDAQCIGGTYKGKMAGAFGQASSFSFQSSKHLTSGEGGIIVTDDLELAQNVRKVSSLGYAGVDAGKGRISKTDIQDPLYDRHVTMGWNYRMPELCAAVALAQTERADVLINVRKNTGKQLYGVVEGCQWLRPQYMEEENENAYWSFSVKIDSQRVSWHSFRDKYMEFGGDGIYSAWKLTYLEPMFQNMSLLGREKKLTRGRDYYKKGLCPVAEILQPDILQFKTNYWNKEDLDKQMFILEKTISYFDGLGV
jgi:perosamine synthetase